MGGFNARSRHSPLSMLIGSIVVASQRKIDGRKESAAPSHLLTEPSVGLVAVTSKPMVGPKSNSFSDRN